jgi:hypothetical protein
MHDGAAAGCRALSAARCLQGFRHRHDDEVPLADIRLADIRLADIRLADIRLADIRLADIRLVDDREIRAVGDVRSESKRSSGS